MPPRTVLFLVFDGVQTLDVTGPLEVFANANGYLAGQGAPVPGRASRRWWPGCAAAPRGRSGSPRSAPARSCWPRPGCWPAGA